MNSIRMTIKHLQDGISSMYPNIMTKFNTFNLTVYDAEECSLFQNN